MENQLTLVQKFWNRHFIVQLICYAYIIVFLYAAMYKLFDYGLFVRQLERSQLLGQFRFILAWLVPLLEIGISVMLFTHSTRLRGLYAAGGLMGLFTIYIIYILVFSLHIPCSCGGILATMGWRDHLIFNSSFIVMAVVAIFTLKNQRQNA